MNVQLLMEHGHELKAIEGYTLRQFNMFIAAIEKLDGIKDRKLLTFLRVGPSSVEEFKQFIKDWFGE